MLDAGQVVELTQKLEKLTCVTIMCANSGHGITTMLGTLSNRFSFETEFATFNDTP